MNFLGIFTLFILATTSVFGATSVDKKENTDDKVKDEVTVSEAATEKSATESKSKNNSITTQLNPALAGGGNSGLRGQVSVDGYTDFKETSEETKSYYAQFAASLFYDLDNGDNIGLFIPLQKDLSGEFEEKFYLNSRLSYSQNSIYTKGIMSLNMRYGALYPTTEASKVRDEMLLGLEVSPTLIFNLNDSIPGLSLIYVPRYTHKFHKYETNRAGEYLVNDTLLQILSANYSFLEKWYFSSTMLYVTSSRYDGARTTDSYLTAQELGYIVSSDVRVRVGIMTGGNILNKQYGENETVEVFDSNSSEFYTGFSYTF